MTGTGINITLSRDILSEKLQKHRTEAFLICPEDCWCWDVEVLLMKEEKEDD